MIDKHGIERDTRPSDCIDWDFMTIDQKKNLSLSGTGGSPESYCYYFDYRARKYLPCRKPSIKEMLEDNFYYLGSDRADEILRRSVDNMVAYKKLKDTIGAE